MIAFWTLAGLAAALSAMAVLIGARRGQAHGLDAAVNVRAEAAAAELSALDSLRERGQLSDEDWQTAWAEAGRRILTDLSPTAASGAAVSPPLAPARTATPRNLALATVATVLASVGLYAIVGQPGLPDQPYEQRVTQWATGDQPLEPAQVAAVVERMARDTPNQPQVWQMLGAARFDAGDPIGAASAFRQALSLQPDHAQSWARLGESLVRANGGTVGADAEAAFVEALKLDANQLGARYFLGEAALVRNDTARVRDMWLPLIAALSPEDPRRADLQARLPGAGQ